MKTFDAVKTVFKRDTNKKNQRRGGKYIIFQSINPQKVTFLVHLQQKHKKTFSTVKLIKTHNTSK